MDLDAMVAELDEHEFEDLEEATKIRLLNDAYQDICARYRWPFLTTTDTSLEIDDEGVVEWPDDLSHIKRVYKLDDTSHRNLLDYDRNFFLEEGLPVFRKHLFNKDIVVVYYVTPEDLETGDEPVFPAKYHRLVVIGALVSAYQMTDDLDYAQVFEAKLDKRIARMAADLFSRDVAPRKRIDIYAH